MNNEKYEEMTKNLKNLIENDATITILANASALLNEYLEDINWVGFYINDGEKLILGPFQGKPACSPIAFNKGILGVAFLGSKTIIVDDVNRFPCHIACDGASKSEIVIPLKSNGKIRYMMDIDSPIEGRFSDTDKKWLEKAAKIIENALN